jgi:hypothetical protein
MIVYIVVYEYKGVLIIVFDGRWDRWVERASLGQVGGEGVVGRRARWRGRHREKSSVERAPPGEIEDRLPSPKEIEDRLLLPKEIEDRLPSSGEIVDKASGRGEKLTYNLLYYY